MSSQLWERTTYASRIEYIIDNTIREFDISKANISILRDANTLSEQEYQYYLTCPRMERQIAIGKLQGSNPGFTEIIKSGIMNAKKVFMQSNSIKDSDVLYIRNDALGIVGSKPIKYLNITDRVAFRESARYSSFVKFNAIDFLYFFDPVLNVEKLDVKGLGDSGVAVHKDYMLEFLCELFYCAQMEGVQPAISLLQTVHQNYLARRLDVGYYREVNPGSLYKLDSSMSMNSSIYTDYATEYYKRYLDISYNDSLLRHFNRILASIYFK